MNKKSYWCPRCGRMFKGIDTYRKHVNSRKCKINDETDDRTIEKTGNTNITNLKRIEL